MPLIQGGPPEWIWERTPEALKWEIITADRPGGKGGLDLWVVPTAQLHKKGLEGRVVNNKALKTIDEQKRRKRPKVW